MASAEPNAVASAASGDEAERPPLRVPSPAPSLEFVRLAGSEGSDAPGDGSVPGDAPAPQAGTPAPPPSPGAAAEPPAPGEADGDDGAGEQKMSDVHESKEGRSFAEGERLSGGAGAQEAKWRSRARGGSRGAVRKVAALASFGQESGGGSSMGTASWRQLSIPLEIRRRIDRMKERHADVTLSRDTRFKVHFADGTVFGRMRWLRALLTCITILTSLTTSILWSAGYNPRSIERSYVSQSFNAINFWSILVHIFASSEFPQVPALLQAHIALFIFSGILRNCADIIWIDEQSTLNSALNLVSWILMLFVVLPGVLQFQSLLRKKIEARSVAMVVEQFLLAAVPGVVIILFFEAEVLNCFFFGADENLETSCATLFFANDTLALFSVSSTFLSFVLYHDMSFELIDVIRAQLEWKLQVIVLLFALSSAISISLVAFREEDLGNNGQLTIAFASYVFYLSMFVILFLQSVRMYQNENDYFADIQQKERLSSARMHDRESVIAQRRSAFSRLSVSARAAGMRMSSGETRDSAESIDEYGMALIQKQRSRRSASTPRPMERPAQDAVEESARFALEAGEDSDSDVEKASDRGNDYKDLVQEIYDSIASVSERAALAPPMADGRVFGDMTPWSILLFGLSMVGFTLIKVFGWANLLPGEISDAGWGLAGSSFLFHLVLTLERRRFPWLVLLHIVTISVSRVGVEDLQHGRYGSGTTRVLGGLCVGLGIFALIRRYSLDVMEKDTKRARRLVALGFALMPSVLSVNLLWALQGSACAWREISYCSEDMLGDCEIPSSCIAEGLACGALGFHVSVLVGFYMGFRARDRHKVEENQLLMSLPQIANFRLPLKYILAGVIMLFASFVAVIAYVASQAGAIDKRSALVIADIVLYGDFFAALIYVAGDWLSAQVNWCILAFAFMFPCYQHIAEESLNLAPSSEGGGFADDASPLPPKAAVEAAAAAAVSADSATLASVASPFVASGSTDASASPAGSAENRVGSSETVESAPRTSPSLRGSRRRLLFIKGSTESLELGKVAQIPRDIVNSVRSGQRLATMHMTQKKAAREETLNPIAVLLLELEARLQTPAEKIRNACGSVDDTYFGEGLGLHMLAFGTLAIFGLGPAVLFAAGASDLRFTFDTAFLTIFVMYRVATLDYTGAARSLPRLHFFLIQLHKVCYIYGQYERGRWMDFGVDLWILLMMNPLVYVGMEAVSEKLLWATKTQDGAVDEGAVNGVRELMSSFVSEYLLVFLLVGCLAVELAGYTAIDREQSDVDPFIIKRASGATQGQLAITAITWLLVFRPSGVSLVDALRLKLPPLESLCSLALLVGWLTALWMLGGRLQVDRGVKEGQALFAALYGICVSTWMVSIGLIFYHMTFIIEKVVRYQKGAQEVTEGAHSHAGIVSSAGADIIFA